ncbi:MAG: hypothetical protein C0412_01475 [Flavobacterium sp.]|nr:hypothetical protein [Flavobacterium sp.]
MENINEQNQTDDTNISTLALIVNAIIGWRKFISICVIFSIIVSTIIAFLIPPKFKSTTSVFPSEKADLLSAFGAAEGVSSLIKSFSPARGLASLGRDPELDKYMAILKSGRVLGEVIQKFDLVNVYEISSYPMEKTTKQLLENVDFSIADEGNLIISVYDKNPQRAADMANFFIDALNRANTDMQLQNARNNLQFIEGRYKKNIQDLATAEDSLRSFQKAYGIIALPTQLEAALKTGAEFAGNLALKEIEFEVLKKSLSSDNSAIQLIKLEIAEIKNKISQFNSGDQSSNNNIKLIVPFKKIPDIGTEYIRRYREVEIQYKILQFITPIYEQSKVEIQRQTASVVILDKAYPAERKSKPKRMFIILGGLAVGLFGALGYIALISRWLTEKKNQTSLYLSLSKLWDEIYSDILFRKKSNKNL